MEKFTYHQWPIDDVSKKLLTDLNRGLSEEVAFERLRKNGPNSLVQMKPISAWQIFRRQFSNLFLILLIIASVFSYFTDGITTGAVLLLITLINLSLGFFQEYKSERSLRELKQIYRSTTRVIRDGKVKLVESENLVVGDLIDLTPGSKVPADARLVEVNSLQINESMLTGEALPITKQTETLPINTPIPDLKNMVFGGTYVTSGQGRAIVCAIGQATEFGKIAGLIEKTDDKTPLEKETVLLSKILGLAAIILAVVVFSLGYYQSLSTWELVTFTIIILVGMVPESLPTAITLILTTGTAKMARKKAIVRRMSVIEALGSVDVIATDKTGTLTENHITLEKMELFERGRFTTGDSRHFNDVLLKSAICTEIDLTRIGDRYLGDPIEVAILERYLLHNSIKGLKSIEKTLQIGFDSKNKYMGVTVKIGRNRELLVKGSPEVLIGFCDLSKSEKETIFSEIERLSQAGYRLLAIAEKNLGKSRASNIANMKFLAIMAFADPPALNVKEALLKIQSAHIRPIILTGDHAQTARAIAEKVGIKVDDSEIITGADLAGLSKKELDTILKKAKIFARLVPEDKIKIVQMLKDAGFIVAMAGDGINDAPALKEADVSIAMGKSGSDVAKDSADIILTDDRYKTITNAIEHGRLIADNIRNVITILIAGNFNEVILVILAFVFGLPAPFLTIQLLWINMIAENFSALSLSFEEPESRTMTDYPRPQGMKFLKKSIIYALILAGISLIATLSLYLWGLNDSIVSARSLVFCFIILLEIAYTFSIRSKYRFWESWRSFFRNKYLLVSTFIILVAQSIILYSPIRNFMKISPPNSGEWAAILIFVLICFILAEIIRHFIDRKWQKDYLPAALTKAAKSG